MFKYYLVFLFLSLVVFRVQSQGEYDKCYFGTAGIDFSSVYPSALTNSGMQALESAASVCDNQGNILFYSNGGNSPTNPGATGAVWNANHEIMDNGFLNDSSGCISSYRGAIAFPSPANNDLNKTGSNSYYLFLRDCVESSFSPPNYNSGLTYCLIDMDQNGGLGKVVEKNQVVVPFNSASSIQTNHEPVAAVRNSNNIDWWIFSYNNDSLYNVELTEDGVGNYQSFDVSDGAITISPRRDKLIAGDKLFDFNASNGQVTYLMNLDIESASFSSDGTKLYSLFGGSIFQYDIDANDLENSKEQIVSVNGINALYLAPDTRIYLFTSNTNNIPGYIECPNNNALDVGLTMDALNLEGKESGDYFTNIPACFLYEETNGCSASLDEEISMRENCTIVPNPADQHFKVNNNTGKTVKRIKVVNSNGAESISVKGDVDSTIDISHLQSGIYFVFVNFKDEVVVKKMVVK